MHETDYSANSQQTHHGHVDVISRGRAFRNEQRDDEDIERGNQRNQEHRRLSQQRGCHEDGCARNHADGGQAEAVVPAERLTDVAAQQRRHGSTEVDAHIEDRKTAIALVAAFGIERSNHRRDVRLEEAIAQDQQGQCGVKRQTVFDGHHEVARCHQQAAEYHRSPGPQKTIRQHAAEERRHVHQRSVGAIDRIGLAVPVLQEPLYHVKNEQSAHAVVAEALPHLGEEEGEQAGRVADQGLLALKIMGVCQGVSSTVLTRICKHEFAIAWASPSHAGRAPAPRRD